MVYKILTIYAGQDGEGEAISFFETAATARSLFNKSAKHVGGEYIVAVALYFKADRLIDIRSVERWKRIQTASGKGYDWTAIDAREYGTPVNRQRDREQPEHNKKTMVRNKTRTRIKHFGKRHGKGG